VGTPVRVRNGVFEGAEGLVTELRGKCKVVITLAAIGKSFSLAVDTKDLETLRVSPTRAEFHAVAP
jgi:transcription antitermination factor NusG